jgi:hypothetical protein
MPVHFTLDTTLGLQFSGSYSQNWGGANEKWVLGFTGWYFITPDGKLYRWDGGRSATGVLVAQLAPLFWERPELLHDAVNQSLPRLLDQALGLSFSGDYFQNFGGAGARWMQGAGGIWYFIRPGGELWRWDGTPNVAGGTFIALLDPFFWEDPEELWGPGV